MNREEQIKRESELRALGYSVQVGTNEEGEEYTALLFDDELEPVTSHWGDDDLITFEEDIAKHQKELKP